MTDRPPTLPPVVRITLPSARRLWRMICAWMPAQLLDEEDRALVELERRMYEAELRETGGEAMASQDIADAMRDRRRG